MMFAETHFHFLPGIDDGPRDIDGTVELLRAAHADGTRRVVATPHMFSPAFRNHEPDEVRDRFEATLAELARRQAARESDRFLGELELLLGAENYLGAEFLSALDRGAVLPIGNGPYLLFETSGYQSLDTVASAADRIREVGWVPILAHAERVRSAARRPAALAELAHQGCLIQVNADSVLQRRFSSLRRVSLALVELGLVALMASDAHDLTARRPCLGEAAVWLRRRFGREPVERWLWTHPGRVIAGEDIRL